MRLFAIIFLIAGLLAPVSAWADLEDNVARCSAISADAMRLRCFDRITQPDLPNLPSNPRTGGVGKWVATTDISRIDDSTNIVLSLTANDQIRNQYGRMSNMTLLIRCMENTTAVSVHFGGHFMSDNSSHGRVTYRVDSRQAKTRNFRESTDHNFLGLWSGGTSIPFIKELMSGESVFIRAVPFSESAVSGEFNISGLENAIQPLREACHW